MIRGIVLLAVTLLYLGVASIASGGGYCIEKESEVFGKVFVLDQSKSGISVEFDSEQSNKDIDDLGINLLRDQFLDYWIEARERINEQNGRINEQKRRKIHDESKLHANFAFVYYIPADIGEWVETMKNITIQARWFGHNNSEYVHLTARINKDAFIFQDERDGTAISEFYKVEAILQKTADGYKIIAQGNSINILKLENSDVIIGTMNSGYEGANGVVMKYDGTNSTEICRWAFGV